MRQVPCKSIACFCFYFLHVVHAFTGSVQIAGKVHEIMGKNAEATRHVRAVSSSSFWDIPLRSKAVASGAHGDLSGSDASLSHEVIGASRPGFLAKAMDFTQNYNIPSVIAMLLFVCGMIILGRFILCHYARKEDVATAKRLAAKNPQGRPGDCPEYGSAVGNAKSPGRGGLESWQAVYTLMKLWLNDPEYKWKARGLMLLVLVHWLVREALWAFVLSSNNAEVVNSISELHESKDTWRVKRALLVWCVVELCVGLPIFNMLDPWVSQWFQISFRTHCTHRILGSYLDGGGQAFYRIKMKEGENKIDNPDQRVGEDITQIASQIYNLYAAVLSAVFGCTMWATVFFGLGGPRLLVLAMLMASLRLGVAYGYFGTRLVNAYQGVLWTAADLRYTLTRVREHAETVALVGGGRREKERSEHNFDQHIDAIKENTWVGMLYGAVMAFIAHFPSLIIWLYQIPAILSGALHVGDAIRVIQGYDQVSKVISFFTDQFVPITVLQANAERLNELWVACRVENTLAQKHALLTSADTNIVSDATRGPDDGAISQAPCLALKQLRFEPADPAVAFAFENVVVTAPGSPISVGGVSVSCMVGRRLLVSGASGVGKSSVLKSLAGLWLNGEGTVRRAVGAEVLVLPSTCYIPQGTLLEVLLYPARAPADPDALDPCSDVAATVLRRSGLETVLNRWGLLGGTRDWAVVLSPGERQRMGFARLFLKLEMMRQQDSQAPGVIAILDESTSAMDLALEAQLYASVCEEVSKGSLIAVASVGHRPSLPRFHDSELQIGEQTLAGKDQKVLDQGTWRMPDGITVPWRHVDLSAVCRW